MTYPYQAAIRAVHASTGPGEELELRRANAALEEMLARINAMRDAEHEGFDSTGAIRAVVAGSGRLTSMDIGARAIRDIPSEELGGYCAEAITAARAAIGEAMRETFTELTGGAVQLDEIPHGDVAAYWREKMRERS